MRVDLSFTDPKLFDYPWIYATQTGSWDLSNHEIEKLREYLLKGGFLMVDDFWGEEEWELFAQTMNSVLPGRAFAAPTSRTSRRSVLAHDSGTSDGSPTGGTAVASM